MSWKDEWIEPDEEMNFDHEIDFDGELSFDFEGFEASLLVLNPNADKEASKSVLCPDCKEEILAVTNDTDTRFICGCKDLKKFEIDNIDGS